MYVPYAQLQNVHSETCHFCKAERNIKILVVIPRNSNFIVTSKSNCQIESIVVSKRVISSLNYCLLFMFYETPPHLVIF